MAEKQKWYGVRYGEKTGVKYMTYSEVMTWKPQQYKGFECEDDAKKYAAIDSIDWNRNEAVVYVDGSLNFDNKTVKTSSAEKLYGTYGIIIFLKDQKEVFCVESARIQDGVKQRINDEGEIERNR